MIEGLARLRRLSLSKTSSEDLPQSVSGGEHQGTMGKMSRSLRKSLSLQMNGTDLPYGDTNVPRNRPRSVPGGAVKALESKKCAREDGSTSPRDVISGSTSSTPSWKLESSQHGSCPDLTISCGGGGKGKSPPVVMRNTHRKLTASMSTDGSGRNTAEEAKRMTSDFTQAQAHSASSLLSPKLQKKSKPPSPLRLMAHKMAHARKSTSSAEPDPPKVAHRTRRSPTFETRKIHNEGQMMSKTGSCPNLIFVRSCEPSFPGNDGNGSDVDEPESCDSSPNQLSPPSHLVNGLVSPLAMARINDRFVFNVGAKSNAGNQVAPQRGHRKLGLSISTDGSGRFKQVEKYRLGKESLAPSSLSRSTGNLDKRPPSPKSSAVSEDVDDVPMSPTSPFRDVNITEVQDHLYIGDLEAGYNEQQLCRYSIDCILDLSNLTSKEVLAQQIKRCPCTCPMASKHARAKLNVHIEDKDDVDIEPYLEEINTFIESARKKGKRVLVHSVHGKSRAAAVVIQYLMTHQGMTLRDAFLMLRKCRPIEMARGLCTTLEKLEVRLFGLEKPTVSLLNEHGRIQAWA
ncbi:uncharacterized protein LOC118407871 [Branchiostoma floridae]|uniref:protein-tyrosine-phosphatase n=2 Tax=Branchiostoma floridae TaxID=7739 RepID=A0A9J7KKQ2_BRAFL|nr:uncharacterized protein LOC118407871 [Branchiostoma floridae]